MKRRRKAEGKCEEEKRRRGEYEKRSMKYEVWSKERIKIKFCEGVPS